MPTEERHAQSGDFLSPTPPLVLPQLILSKPVLAFSEATKKVQNLSQAAAKELSALR